MSAFVEIIFDNSDDRFPYGKARAHSTTNDRYEEG